MSVMIQYRWRQYFYYCFMFDQICPYLIFEAKHGWMRNFLLPLFQLYCSIHFLSWEWNGNRKSSKRNLFRVDCVELAVSIPTWEYARLFHTRSTHQMVIVLLILLFCCIARASYSISQLSFATAGCFKLWEIWVTCLHTNTTCICIISREGIDLLLDKE